MSLKVQIKRYAVPLAAIVALVMCAAAVGAYVLQHQRLRFPWEDVYSIRAEFSTAQAVTPGQGQNVTVAGVTVGEITKVELDEGHAVVTMDIDRDKLDAVYGDATMVLRPKTGLKDMSIALDPGTPRAGRLESGEALPVGRTTPDVNPDEVLAALDADTRAYLAVAINEGGRALRGRGPDLRAILEASQPTLAATRRITTAVADRREKLRRLMANLRELSDAAAAKDTDLRSLIDGANATFGALADEEGALRTSIGRLPGTLSSASTALTQTSALATDLRPALSDLRPTVQALAPTLREVRPLLRDGEPILREKIRPLVREARPVVQDLRPTVRDLRAVTPKLDAAFDVLNYVVNELAYNPPGTEEGYLFWTAWFFHNANSILSVEDAQGVAWRGQLMVSCSTAAELGKVQPLLTLLAAIPACPADGSKTVLPDVPDVPAARTATKGEGR